MEVLGTVPRDLVAGKDGWLFLRNRVVPPARVRDRAIRLTALKAAAVERRLARLGSQLILLPIPRKAVACREKLPTGMDPDIEFEANLSKALTARGLEAMDVSRALAQVPVEGRYFRRDSHWEPRGAAALAQAVAQEYPELATGEVDVELVEERGPAEKALLVFAAIGHDHPVNDWVDQDTVLTQVIKSEALQGTLDEGPLDVDVAVVGSSFTKEHQFAELLVAALGQLVYPGGVRAKPFGGSLGHFAYVAQQRKLPRHVLFEFPVHQCFLVGHGGKAVQRSLTTFFVCTSHAGAAPLPKERLAPAEMTQQGDSGVKVFFPDGTLLSTGDGVLQLRVRTQTKKITEWQLLSSDTGQIWPHPPGEYDQLIPIIQDQPNGHRVRLSGVGAPGNEPEVDVEVVVDADLDASVEIPLTADGEANFRGPLKALSVGTHDVVTVQWSDQPASVSVLIRGASPDGVERVVRAQFKGPRSRICALSLTPLRGGQLTSIEVRGAASEVQAFLAPQLRD
jgi:hypothetical protein